MNQPIIATAFPSPMKIESTTDLGEDALRNPGKYNGFMGISVGHKFFSKSTMEQYFLWGSHIFKEFLILLMDDPDKYNFMIFEKLTEEEALKKVRIIGDERARSYIKVIRKIGANNIKVIRFRDFDYSHKYQHMLQETKQYAEKNPEFKNELHNLMEEGIGGKIAEYVQNNSLSPAKTGEIKEVLAGYILEEFVSLLYFTETGYTIEVDPTKEFSTKALVYNGHFLDYTKLLLLTRRGHIYTHPEGITKSTY